MNTNFLKSRANSICSPFSTTIKSFQPFRELRAERLRKRSTSQSKTCEKSLLEISETEQNKKCNEKIANISKMWESIKKGLDSTVDHEITRKNTTKCVWNLSIPENFRKIPNTGRPKNVTPGRFLSKGFISNRKATMYFERVFIENIGKSHMKIIKYRLKKVINYIN